MTGVSHVILDRVPQHRLLKTARRRWHKQTGRRPAVIFAQVASTFGKLFSRLSLKPAVLFSAPIRFRASPTTRLISGARC
jgi:hypothetical protein